MPLSGTNIRNRLKIEDLLDIADEEQLKGFRWADGVCDAVNAYLSLNHRVSIDNTGLEVADTIKQFPLQVQLRLSLLLIDVETGETHVSRKTLDNFPVIPEDLMEDAEAAGEEEEEPTHSPSPRQPGGYERYEDDLPPEPRRRHRPEVADDKADVNTSPNSTIMMMIAGVLVVIALVMTITASKMSQETGQPMQSSTLEVVLRVLGDVFKTSANTNPDSRGTDTTESSGDSADGEDVEPSPRYQDDSEVSPSSPDYSQ